MRDVIVRPEVFKHTARVRRADQLDSFFYSMFFTLIKSHKHAYVADEHIKATVLNCHVFKHTRIRVPLAPD